jgi:hypothetical protein
MSLMVYVTDPGGSHASGDAATLSIHAQIGL